MINKVRLTNFFSFLDHSISLEPDVNVLLGINGSGKSNFIKAFELLREGVSGKGIQKLVIEDWGGFDNIMCKSQNETVFPNSVGLEFTLNGDALKHYGFPFREEVIYKIVLVKKPGLDNYFISEKLQTVSDFIYLDFYQGKGRIHEHESFQGHRNQTQEPETKNAWNKHGKWINYEDQDSQELVLAHIFDSDRYYEINTVRKALSDMVAYTYFDTSPSSGLRKAVKATGNKRLKGDGGNLPQILNTLKISHKSDFKAITEALSDVNEQFRGFDFNFLGSGLFELMLDEHGLESAIHVSQISDGTLRYLCLLAILYNPERGRLICIDEPEIGLHPDMIYNIASAVKQNSDASTFLIATHHEDVVEAFEIRQLRVFEKDENNLTYVEQYTEEEFQNSYDSIQPGQLWKRGLIGGNRW